MIAALLTLALAAETVAITGAKVHTLGAAGTLENATLVIADGRIAAVGRDVAIPAGARRIDATGKVVTPGLMDSLSRIGLIEVEYVEETFDAKVEDDRITAAFDVEDALNPRSSLIPVNRIEGLTRAAVFPQTGKSLIAGRAALVQLGGGAMVLRPRVAMYVELGDSGAEKSGGSRGASILRLREALQDAADYGRNKAAFESGGRREYALSRLDLEALQPVVHGEMPVVISARRASDIEAALRLARDYRLKLILARANEGWIVADQIAAARVPVLVEVLDNLPQFERLGATLENAARMRRAGVTVALMSGDAHNARNLKQAAGNAVAYGMAWEDALRAVTTVPAQIWGLSESYGTLEAGRDADVVIWDGDPLELTTFADAVFIRGHEVPMVSRQTLLRDRYKDLPARPVLKQP